MPVTKGKKKAGFRITVKKYTVRIICNSSSCAWNTKIRSGLRLIR